LKGYGLIGQRCYAKYDWGKKSRINAIGALLENKLITVSLFEYSIHSEIFHTWLCEDLIPKLDGGEMIVMDNATFHKRSESFYHLTVLT
jgi:hypothetical protein